MRAPLFLAACAVVPLAGAGELIEVTGSNIKRAEIEGPAPLLVLRREDLGLRAGQNLQEILIGLPYANFGSFAESRNGGAAGVSLRGLGLDSTLVLVNGRRVAVNGFPSANGGAFVNINTIPTSAIERIEILKDGASAIYGSDAVAGVVNVILRKDFQGAELVGSYGESSRGDTDEARAAMTAGAGSLARDGFNAMLTLEYYHRDRLDASQRERSRTADQRGNGGRDWRQTQGRPGTWLTSGLGGFTANTPMPGCPAEALENGVPTRNTCAHNENDYLVAYPRTQRKSAVGRAAVALSPAVTAFLEASWMHLESEVGGNPAGDQFLLPAGHNSNPYPFPVEILHRWLEVGRRYDMIDARTKRVVAGVEGTFRGIDFEAAVNRASDANRVESLNAIARASRDALVAGNAYSFLDPSRNDPALLDAARAQTWRSRETTLESVDARASGTVFDLPAGPVALAAGFERRRERLAGARDPSYASYLNFLADSNEAGRRSVTALFAESVVPLHSTVEVQLAVRGERYSDAGDSTAPKVALAWKPLPALLLRAGYSEGFRAPSLYQLNLDRRINRVQVTDTPRCAAYTAAYGAGDARTVGPCGFRGVLASTEGNPSLHAEESTSKALGLVFEPAQGLSIGIDVFDIRQRGRVTIPDIRTLIAYEDSFPGKVVRNAPTQNDLLVGARGTIVGQTSGQIGLFGTYFNSGFQEVRGTDLEVRWRYGIGPGVLRVESLNTWLHSLRSVGAPGLPTADLTTQGWTPRYRGWHQASWTQGSWRASAVVNVIGSSVDPGPVGGMVESWTTVDLQLGFAARKNLVFIAGVRNVDDRMPPFFDDVFGFEEATHSIVGRAYYLRAAYRF